jgi:hypothetical protein
MVELHNFIHFSFECDHPGIMIGSDILYLDLGELGILLFLLNVITLVSLTLFLIIIIF